MNTFIRVKLDLRHVLCGLVACFAINIAYAQSHQGPSKMQRCQAELASVQGNDRKIQLRQCLVNRTEGERLAVRDCAKQLREMPPDPAVDKALMQKKCVAGALNVAHAQLPKRVAAPSDTPKSPAATVTKVAAQGEEKQP